MIRPFSVVRLGTLSKRQHYWRLIDYFTNEILILGRITFFIQMDSDGTEDFLVTVLSKLCLQMELKKL